MRKILAVDVRLRISTSAADALGVLNQTLARGMYQSVGKAVPFQWRRIGAQAVRPLRRAPHASSVHWAHRLEARDFDGRSGKCLQRL